MSAFNKFLTAVNYNPIIKYDVLHYRMMEKYFFGSKDKKKHNK